MKILKIILGIFLINNFLFANSDTNLQKISFNINKLNYKINKLKQEIIKNKKNNNNTFFIETIKIKTGKKFKIIKKNPMNLYNFVSNLNNFLFKKTFNRNTTLNQLSNDINNQIKNGKLVLPNEFKNLKNINLKLTFQLNTNLYHNLKSFEGFKFKCPNNKKSFILKNNLLKPYKIKIKNKLFLVGTCKKQNLKNLRFYLLYKNIN